MILRTTNIVRKVVRFPSKQSKFFLRGRYFSVEWLVRKCNLQIVPNKGSLWKKKKTCSNFQTSHDAERHLSTASLGDKLYCGEEIRFHFDEWTVGCSQVAHGHRGGLVRNNSRNTWWSCFCRGSGAPFSSSSTANDVLSYLEGDHTAFRLYFFSLVVTISVPLLDPVIISPVAQLYSHISWKPYLTCAQRTFSCLPVSTYFPGF